VHDLSPKVQLSNKDLFDPRTGQGLILEALKVDPRYMSGYGGPKTAYNGCNRFTKRLVDRVCGPTFKWDQPEDRKALQLLRDAMSFWRVNPVRITGLVREIHHTEYTAFEGFPYDFTGLSTAGKPVALRKETTVYDVAGRFRAMPEYPGPFNKKIVVTRTYKPKSAFDQDVIEFRGVFDFPVSGLTTKTTHWEWHDERIAQYVAETGNVYVLAAASSSDSDSSDDDLTPIIPPEPSAAPVPLPPAEPFRATWATRAQAAAAAFGDIGTAPDLTPVAPGTPPQPAIGGIPPATPPATPPPGAPPASVVDPAVQPPRRPGFWDCFKLGTCFRPSQAVER
jgi:hypothetical protein